jgi:mitochondrial fission protein ELM1
VTGSGPRVWGLLGERTGDNNQVLALCEALGVPFETRTLRYNLRRAIGGNILGATLATLTPETRRWVRPPWPDLVIAIGRRSVPVARWIRKKSGGSTRLVLLGHPRVSPDIFDLVITTRQYPVPPGDNVLLLPMAMTRFPELPKPTSEEQAVLSELPRPHLLMAIGGPTKFWKIDEDAIADAVEALHARALRLGGGLIAIGSPRTEAGAMNVLRGSLRRRDNALLVESGRARFPVLLRDADEIFVTGDSMSMLSEAIQAGKRVGIIPIRQSDRGRRSLGPNPCSSGPSMHRRDLRRFWNHLIEQGLVGTIDEPVAGHFENPAQTARDAVAKLLESSEFPLNRRALPDD